VSRLNDRISPSGHIGSDAVCLSLPWWPFVRRRGMTTVRFSTTIGMAAPLRSLSLSFHYLIDNKQRSANPLGRLLVLHPSEGFERTKPSAGFSLDSSQYL
jgi:hypothetical protein